MGSEKFCYLIIKGEKLFNLAKPHVFQAEIIIASVYVFIPYQPVSVKLNLVTLTMKEGHESSMQARNSLSIWTWELQTQKIEAFFLFVPKTISTFQKIQLW